MTAVLDQNRHRNLRLLRRSVRNKQGMIAVLLGDFFLFVFLPLALLSFHVLRRRASSSGVVRGTSGYWLWQLRSSVSLLWFCIGTGPALSPLC